MRIEANTVEELPDLGEAHKGSTAIIGKGFLRKMYMYVWISENTRAGIPAHGQWKFACYPSRP